MGKEWDRIDYSWKLYLVVGLVGLKETLENRGTIGEPATLNSGLFRNTKRELQQMKLNF